MDAGRNQENAEKENQFILFCRCFCCVVDSWLRQEASCRFGRCSSGTELGDEETVPEENMDQSGPGIEAVKNDESTGAGKKVEAFAEKIQEAVGDRDLEAFANLLFYPCIFVTADEETITLKNQEDLFKQNPDMVFGDDLMVAVANVDTVSLKMTDKGVAMGEGNSKIIFQEKSDGSLGIIEIRE